jgi:hypothetical protein
MDAVMLLAPSVACLIGAGLGLVGLVSPKAAAKIVRLQADPANPDGVAEFRASFGGLFFAVHAACLASIALTVVAPFWLQVTIIACGVAALIWWGTAFGRLVAVAVDPVARTPYQLFAIGFELVLGALLFAPLLVFG